MIYRVDDKESDKVSKLLIDNKVEHEKYYGTLAAFSKEEAAWRVQCYEESEKVIFTDEQREYLEGALERVFDDDEYIVDGEWLYELSNNNIPISINEYNEMNKDEPKKVMTKAMKRGDR